jgi:hypothetical protein
MNRTSIAIANMVAAPRLTAYGSSTGERAKSSGGIGAGGGRILACQRSARQHSSGRLHSFRTRAIEH